MEITHPGGGDEGLKEYRCRQDWWLCSRCGGEGGALRYWEMCGLGNGQRVVRMGRDGRPQ